MSDPTITFSYYDPASADTYRVECELSGSFVEAVRYLCQSWRDPVAYAHLADIPEPHRSAITQEIARRTR